MEVKVGQDGLGRSGGVGEGNVGELDGEGGVRWMVRLDSEMCWVGSVDRSRREEGACVDFVIFSATKTFSYPSSKKTKKWATH